ncbi:MAG: glycoside hydrolase family 10 protein [Pyrinomonadaceae bacterium]
MKIAIFFMLLTTMVPAQPLPEVEREFRAVWIATVDNIDFPSRKGLSADAQKAELLAALDLAKRLRLNAVIFQVRPMADAVYRSELEPWSEFLTGEMGKPQDFDPLEFLVAEAHRRGILVHAWFNPYRAFHPAAKTISDRHVSKTQPGIVRQYGRYMWLDPTEPAARKHSVDVITDVVRRYDIDGVHFDDYFYPYAEKDASGERIEFPDDSNWREYLRTAQMFSNEKLRRIPLKRDDWRRANVNEFIAAVGRAIKKIKPDIVYGISPFGIWQPMPERDIVGFNAYAELYADARKWLQDGTVDYLAPQLYWETARKGQSFPVLLEWWREQNVKGRHIWPGLASYRIGSTPTFTAGEIGSQIERTRANALTKGSIHFSFRSLRNDLGKIQNVLRESVYKREALTPRFSWIKARSPDSPKVRVARTNGFTRVTWLERGSRKAFWFVVYAKDKDGWSYSILPASERSISLSAERKIEKIVVHSVDRLGNESR